MTSCPDPVPLDRALAWWFGELPAPEADAIEEHLFTCGSCTEELESLRSVGAGVAAAFRAGALGVALTPRVIEAARGDGMRIRSYRMADGESVRCTAGPLDDAIELRLVLTDPHADAVDLVSEATVLDSGEHFARMNEGTPVDRETGEVAYLFPGAEIRAIPRTRWEITARREGELVGAYTLHHTPWNELPAAERDGPEA